MPNWAISRVQMEGIANCPLYGKTKDGEAFFDLNKIIRMPKRLAVGGIRSTTTRVFYALVSRGYASGQFDRMPRAERILEVRRAIDGDDVKYQFDREQAHEQARIAIDALKFLRNYERYGCPTWHEWRLRYWGTVRNTDNLHVISDDVIMFTTPWSPPRDALTRLAKMYPDSIILVSYVIEGNGSGYMRFKCGKLDRSKYDECDPYWVEPLFGPYYEDDEED